MKIRNNPLKANTIKALRTIYKDNKAPIWDVVIEELSVPKSRKRQINLGKLSKITEKGDKILVPGKILGSGVLTHNLVIGAFSYSQNARNKIKKTGGKALSLIDFVEKHTNGKDVKLIG